MSAAIDPLLEVAIILPVLNEASQLVRLARRIEQWQAKQVVLVDGGSQDTTFETLQQMFADSSNVSVLQTPAGRAEQMQAGAEHVQNADARWLLFVHADTQLPAHYADALLSAEQTNRTWGRFDVRFEATNSGLDRAMSVIAYFINLRSRLTRVATGDQAIFVRADVFSQVGGYANMPLMEDIDLCKRLRKLSKPLSSPLLVTTSPRRWQSKGVVRTVVLMWALRFAYFIGVPSESLAKFYRSVR